MGSYVRKTSADLANDAANAVLYIDLHNRQYPSVRSPLVFV